jgi:Ser/Thr protein kinase RdoA (MazF antagonist)
MAVSEDLPAAVRATVEGQYGLRLLERASSVDGEESRGWRVGSDAGDVLVQLAPGWRSTSELRWGHRLLRFAANSIAEVALPLGTISGETVVTIAGRPMTVFPFISGMQPDDQNDALFADAARLLARLHATLAAWRGGDRPSLSEDSPWRRTPAVEPSELADPDLDGWYEDLFHRNPPPLERGIIHGDFYPRNLIVRGERIVCVIDWNESRIDFLARSSGGRYGSSLGPLTGRASTAIEPRAF